MLIKNIMNKKVLQIIALVVIVGSITYIELTKPASELTGAQDVVVTPPPPTETATSTIATATSTKKIVRKVVKNFPKAKEINDPTGFINTGPFTLSSIVGKKVILLDFWTYSCINCRRTTPYLNAWYEKYKDLGFTIVGVHTPEFDFEKVMSNVQQGTKELGIKAEPTIL